MKPSKWIAVAAASAMLVLCLLPALALAADVPASAVSTSSESASAASVSVTDFLEAASPESICPEGVYQDFANAGQVQKQLVHAEAGVPARFKGTFTLTIKGTALQMTNASSSTDPGVQMTLTAKRSAPARFHVQRISKSSKWCFIRNAASGRALTADGGKVIQRKTTKAKNQQWRFLKMKDGSYAIQSRSAGLRMGVSSAKAGAKLFLQTASNADTQRFIVSKAKAPYMLDRLWMMNLANKASDKKSLQMLNCGYDIPAKAKKRLLDEMQTTKDICGTYGFILIDLRTGEGFSYDSDASIYSASALKGPYLVAVNKYQKKEARAYRDWYYELIHKSSNEVYTFLRGELGSKSFKKYLEYADVHDLDYEEEYQFVRVDSMAKLWVCNWEYFNSGEANAKNIRGLYTYPNGSEIYTVLGTRPGYTTYSKGGWVTDAGICTSYNTCGIVLRPDGTAYLLSVLSMLNPETWEEVQMRSLVAAIDAAYGATNANS